MSNHRVVENRKTRDEPSRTRAPRGLAQPRINGFLQTIPGFPLLIPREGAEKTPPDPQNPNLQSMSILETG